jgi:serine/threonine protein kinase
LEYTLEFHKNKSQTWVRCTLTLYEAASSCLREDLPASIYILKDVCETLGYIHTQGFLHNDLKGNNIVLEKTVKGFHPVIIDFGKCVKIKKAKLKKPKLDVNSALKRYPHIAPEIHRGERQTTSSDIFSFGYLVSFIKNKAKFNAFSMIVKKCTSSVPSKRPSLLEISEMLSDSLVVNNS